MKNIKTYEITQEYQNISIVSNTAQIEIKTSENNQTSIICDEHKNRSHSVEVVNNSLSITPTKRRWYTYLYPCFTTSKITISISKELSSLNIKCNTSSINISSIKSNNVTIKTNTGKISLDRVIASEKMSIHTNTGKINLNESDAGEIFIKTNTGNVSGTLLTDKAFVIRCNTGKINIPDTFGSSKCEIISNTGHINFKIKKN
jgi:DUF4097 and DUF4098 domain-containing protein YvlB